MKHLRTITLLLILLLSCSFAMPAMAVLNPSGFADYEYTTDYKGNAIITRYKGPDTDVVIPSELDGHSVTSIGTRAFFCHSGIKSVVIPDSVTEINPFAFTNCTGLSSVVIPDTITYIGGYAFLYCSSISSVTLPPSLTSIQPYTFYGCTSLCELILPQSLESIESYALGYTGLSVLALPDSLAQIDTTAFSGCRSLAAFEVSKDHPVYAVMDGVLYDKIAHALVCYPPAKGGSSYAIQEETQVINAFALSCTHLTDLIIPESVVRIEDNAFAASDLTSVTIPSGITVIPKEAFYNCSNLSNVCLPEGITNIGDNAFHGCRSLNTIAIPESTAFIGQNAFSLYDETTETIVPNPNITLLVAQDSPIVQYCETNGLNCSVY